MYLTVCDLKSKIVALTAPRVKPSMNMSCAVNIRRKYHVASSTMVLRSIEISSPAFFERATKNRVSEKARKSEASM